MFKKAKVDDKFWSLKYGECVITEICTESFYPIQGKNSEGLIHFGWTIGGKRYFTDITKDAYWHKPQIIEAQPEIIEGWVNFYVISGGSLQNVHISVLHPTREIALQNRHTCNVYFGEPYHINYEYYEEGKGKE